MMSPYRYLLQWAAVVLRAWLFVINDIPLDAVYVTALAETRCCRQQGHDKSLVLWPWASGIRGLICRPPKAP